MPLSGAAWRALSGIVVAGANSAALVLDEAGSVGLSFVSDGGNHPMQAIKEVEDAKALMREAANWSVMRWLSEKKRVRKAADIANDALDGVERKVKAAW